MLVVLPVCHVAAETVSVCAAGPIDHRELQIWLDTGLGLSKKCSVAIEELAVAKLLARDARSQNLDKDPVVARKLRMLDAMASREMAKRVIEARVAQPSPDQVAALIARHGGSFEQAARVRLRWIYRRGAGDDVEAISFLKDIRRHILDGDISFEEAARLYSQSESRYRGGFAGSVSAGDISPQLAEVVFALGEGEISEVISNETGQHIFRVDKKTPARFITDVEKNSKAREIVIQLAKKQDWDHFIRGILRTAQPVINLENLSSNDNKTIVMKLGTGETLTTAQTRDLGTFTPEKARERLTEMAILIRLPEAARKLGFELDDDIRIEYDLRKTRRLATIIMHQIQDKKVGPPTEKEIEAEWLADRPRYRGQERFRLWRAHFDLTHDDAVIEANRLRDLILASESELTVAGDIDATERWIDNGSLIEMGPVAAKVIRTTDESGVLGPFHHGNDLWLIRVLEHQEPQMQPLEDVSLRIATNLEDSARKAVFSQVYDDKLASAELKNIKDPDCSSKNRTITPRIRKLD